MNLLNKLKEKSLQLSSSNFDDLALDIFRFQAENNKVYKDYLTALSFDINTVTSVEKVPFLPIEFFKSSKVISGKWDPTTSYKSSGTTSMDRSIHYVEDERHYLSNTRKVFEEIYQSLDDCVFFALLPSYQSQGHSSLIKMVDYFMGVAQDKSQEKMGGYYLEDFDRLIKDLKGAVNHISIKKSKKKVILFGVGYALLDLAVHVNDLGEDLGGVTIIETGGMKGRRKEMVKADFYSRLKSSMGDVAIHSEYGMTELFSQAYSQDERYYDLPKQMRVIIRDINDPFTILKNGRVGGINIIDLANVHSCSFIETKDLGRSFEADKFEIIGRIDNSDIRGCNLLVV